jgi:hypothetical protein
MESSRKINRLGSDFQRVQSSVMESSGKTNRLGSDFQRVQSSVMESSRKIHRLGSDFQRVQSSMRQVPGFLRTASLDFQRVDSLGYSRNVCCTSYVHMLVPAYVDVSSTNQNMSAPSQEQDTPQDLCKSSFADRQAMVGHRLDAPQANECARMPASLFFKNNKNTPSYNKKNTSHYSTRRNKMALQGGQLGRATGHACNSWRAERQKWWLMSHEWSFLLPKNGGTSLAELTHNEELKEESIEGVVQRVSVDDIESKGVGMENIQLQDAIIDTSANSSEFGGCIEQAREHDASNNSTHSACEDIELSCKESAKVTASSSKTRKPGFRFPSSFISSLRPSLRRHSSFNVSTQPNARNSYSKREVTANAIFGSVHGIYNGAEDVSLHFRERVLWQEVSFL